MDQNNDRNKLDEIVEGRDFYSTDDKLDKIEVFDDGDNGGDVLNEKIDGRKHRIFGLKKYSLGFLAKWHTYYKKIDEKYNDRKGDKMAYVSRKDCAYEMWKVRQVKLTKEEKEYVDRGLALIAKQTPVVVNKKIMASHCWKCGYEYQKDNEIFCSSCGKKRKKEIRVIGKKMKHGHHKKRGPRGKYKVKVKNVVTTNIAEAASSS